MRAEQDEVRLAELATLRSEAETAAEERSVQEESLRSQIDAFNIAEQEQRKRLDKAETALVEKSATQLQLEANLQQLIQQEQSFTAEIETLRRAAGEQNKRTEETAVPLPNH